MIKRNTCAYGLLGWSEKNFAVTKEEEPGGNIIVQREIPAGNSIASNTNFVTGCYAMAKLHKYLYSENTERELRNNGTRDV